jgi:DNA anti-recombination protein RmuC
LAVLPAPTDRAAEIEQVRTEHATWRKLGQRNLERAHEENARLRADQAAELHRIREVVRRLAAHAVGFQDVLDESDRGPWGKTLAADIAELRRMADEAQQDEARS